MFCCRRILFTGFKHPNVKGVKLHVTSRAFLDDGHFEVTITLTPYMVLPLFATRFADYAGGIRVSFIQPRLFWFDIKCSAWEIYHTDLYGWNLSTCFPCMHNLGCTVVLIDKLLWFYHTTLLFWCVWRSPTPPNSSRNVQKHGHSLRFQVNGR